MEISTIVIISVVAFLVISIACTAIRHFRSKKSELQEVLWIGSTEAKVMDLLKESEPIKSHYEEYEKARATSIALKKAIIRNLVDNEYSYGDLNGPRLFHLLPDLIELQNTLKLRPIIKEIEEQYKKYEEARAVAVAESKWLDDIIPLIIKRLQVNESFERLIKEGGHTPKEANTIMTDYFSENGKKFIRKVLDEMFGGES